MPAPSGIRSRVDAYSRGKFFRERLVVFELFFLLVWKRGFYVRFIWSFRDLIGAQSHVITALHLYRPPLRIKKTLLNRKVFLELLLASRLGVAMDQVWYAFFYWWLIKLRAISSASEDIFCVLFHVWVVNYAFKDAFLPHQVKGTVVVRSLLCGPFCDMAAHNRFMWTLNKAFLAHDTFDLEHTWMRVDMIGFVTWDFLFYFYISSYLHHCSLACLWIGQALALYRWHCLVLSTRLPNARISHHIYWSGIFLEIFSNNNTELWCPNCWYRLALPLVSQDFCFRLEVYLTSWSHVLALIISFIFVISLLLGILNHHRAVLDSPVFIIRCRNKEHAVFLLLWGLDQEHAAHIWTLTDSLSLDYIMFLRLIPLLIVQIWIRRP